MTRRNIWSSIALYFGIAVIGCSGNEPTAPPAPIASFDDTLLDSAWQRPDASSVLEFKALAVRQRTTRSALHAAVVDGQPTFERSRSHATATFSADQVIVRRSRRSQDAPPLTLRMSQFGRPGAVQRLAAVTPSASANRVEYRRRTMTEWYVNGEVGLQQGFDVDERPRGDGPLVIAMHVAAPFRARTDDSERTIAIESAESRFTLSSLRAVDSLDRALPVAFDANGTTIAIRVDDRLASYPITIDPMIWGERDTVYPSENALSEDFGRAVDISGDWAAVGAGSLGGGAARVDMFKRNGLTWQHMQRLQAADTVPGDFFGFSLDLDGNRLVVGAPKRKDGATTRGGAYVFERSGNSWSETFAMHDKWGVSKPEANGDFGHAVASADAYIYAGCPKCAKGGSSAAGRGWAYVKNASNNWVRIVFADLGATVTSTNAHFGWSVTAQGSGSAWGTPNVNGEVRIFDCSGGGVCVPQGAVSSSTPFDRFGDAVGLTATSLLVGVPGDNGGGVNAGKVLAYQRSNLATAPQVLAPAGLSAGDQFGLSLSVFSDKLLIGAPYDDGPGNTMSSAGAVYAYSGAAGTYTLDQTLRPSDAAAGDEFGFRVGTDGTYGIAGAPKKASPSGPNTNGNPTGGSHVLFFGKSQGDVCSTDTECVSGFCADSRCCDTACGGACEQCDGAVDGQCSPLADGTQIAACGSYLCDGNSGTCPTSCQSSGDCVSTSFCNGKMECDGLKGQGATCGDNGECQSNHCVDGVCCDTACTGTCQACAAALKASGAGDGVCGDASSGTSEAGCTAAPPCGNTGLCAGDGTCAQTGYGASCGAADCTGSEERARICSGTGSCILDNPVSCAPYVCSGSACGTTCAADSQCTTGYFCNTSSSACQPKKSLGEACGGNTQCDSNFCVDGVCCDTSCTGSCVACSAALKGTGSDGVCDNVLAGTNPRSACATTQASSCGTTGFCDGSGACELFGSGTPCGATTCNGNNVTGLVCDGAGTCQQATGQDCAPYICKGDACASPCTDANDCISNEYYCTGGTCRRKLDDGQPCGGAGECSSGFCADGVCCDSPCQGQCEACDNSGKVGQCVPVTGAPHGSRMPCTGAGPCIGACDGATAASCTFPNLGTACAPAECEGDALKPVSACDGAGLCVTPSTQDCGAYTCDDGLLACNTSCTSSADCAAGAVCDTTDGSCRAATNVCEDAFTVRTPDGQLQDCKPYRCTAGECAEICGGPGDCADGYRCEAQVCVSEEDAGAGGTASGGSGGAAGSASGGDLAGGSGGDGAAGSGGKPSAAGTGDESGCGCSVPGAAADTRPTSTWGALLGCLLVLGRRRRRE